MPRIRTIKPEFPQSESMGRVSRDARLLFIQLWTLCDDAGRTRAASRMLASLLYPYDNDAPRLVDKWMAELEAENCVIRYQVDGQTYLQVCNWLNHQKIDRPSTSKIPPFDEPSRVLANPREPSSLDQGRDQGKEGSRGAQARRGARFAIAQLPEDWKTFCKANRPDLDPATVFAKFSDYWHGVPGARGCKLDWAATWRNFVRTERPPPGAKPPEPLKPWHQTASGTKAKGEELGIKPDQFRLPDGREDWQAFKSEVLKRAGVQIQVAA